MKLLRAVVGKIRRDSIMNAYTRGELKMEETQNEIKRSFLRWFGHIKRMDGHRIPKKIIGNEDEWKKTQGQITHTMDRPS
jgi:hypothetical protein